MDPEKNFSAITAIVPAYNEAERIGPVLHTLVASKMFAEIIVIDDGSTDATGNIAKRYPVRYIKNERNLGKAHSMDKGVALSKTQYIFFCDADISGLSNEHLRTIIEPVTHNEVEMFIGMRNRKWYTAHQLLVFVPLLGGERAMTKRLWEILPSYYKHRFKIETGLNFFAHYYGKGLRFAIIPGVSQMIKEKKYGLVRGLAQRIGMYKDIFLAQLRLEFFDLPKDERKGRQSLINVVFSIIAIVVGSVVLYGVRTGLSRFVSQLFQKELAEDPNAPIIQALIEMTKNYSPATFRFGSVLLIVSGVVAFVFSANRAYRFLNSRFKKMLSKDQPLR